MEKRFQFTAPTQRELAFSQQGKILLPVTVVLWLATNVFHWPIPFLRSAVGLILSLFIIWLTLRLGDIQRREFQSKYGSVELTPRELRISLSERSLMRIQWHDFKGTEVKKGWLHLQYLDAQVDMGGQSKRLDRIQLSQLEDPDGLLEALRAQTSALNYLKQ